MDDDYYLGLDGGGTKAAACILDAEGRERGRGQGGPCNIATCDDATLTASIMGAAAEARAAAGLPPDARFEAVCAGVAGYTAKRRRADFARLLSEACPADRHRVEPDYVIAWWGATAGEPGIIVSAGTGAVVYGRNAAGEEARVDGRGFLLGDRGSGYWIGSFVLRKLMLRLDGAGPNDFDRRVMAALGVTDADELVEWVYRDMRPGKIAGLAEVVGRLAADGDATASVFLGNAGTALSSSAAVALRRLGMRPDSAGVWLLGGLWNIGARIRTSFEEFLPRQFENEAFFGPPNIRAPLHDAAHGAALLAATRQARE
jgi:N-acetylglucosamine kinase-like BadF-type ATPase